ncbi:hypothetical protein LIER_01641 [Lithospermum erythrorhizon]|uniref:Retrotransposon gag domain-containing protein n=1 Tax=Lithospermum erythrorhizon TaxID=34254 RepID=A0AAV3NLR1_LITER
MLHPREKDVARGQGEVRAPIGPRENPPHQLAPFVGTHNPPIQISEHASESQRSPNRRRRIDHGKDKVHDDEVLPDNQSSNSNHAPHRAGGKGKHTRHLRERSLSEDSHTREPSYHHGHDLTPSDNSPESSNPDLQKQVDELKALFKDIAPGQGPVKHNTLLPFSDRLRHAEMSREFRMPKFKIFSGIGDPSNHLKSFDSQLSFWASDDEVYARAFPNRLSGQALKWFHKLPPNSIDCWQDGVELFMDNFGASIVADADERSLMEIQQKPGETLRSYATRFEEVATNIPTANEKGTMISFFHGLRYGPLKEKLVLGPPGTRNELSKLVIQYIKLEEVKLLSEQMADARARGKKSTDDWHGGSPKKGRVWDRLQKSKDNLSLKRPRLRSP